MTLIHAEGFDIYDSNTDVAGANTRWAQTGTMQFTKTGGRFGGGALILNGNNPSVNCWNLSFSGPAAGATLYTSFAYKAGGLPSSGSPSNAWILQFIDSGAAFIGGLFITSTGQIQLMSQTGAVLATTAFAINPGVWYWFEVKFIQGTTGSNGTIELRINGAVVATATGIDTFAASGRTTAAITLGPGSKSGTDVVDDVIINDAAGSVNNGYPGDRRIDTTRPTGDSGTVQWTSSSGTSHNDVDDPNGSSDGDATYISSNTVGQVSRFLNGALVGTSADIMGVVVRHKAKKTDAGARTLNNEVKSGAATVDSTAYDPGTAYAWSPANGDNILELNPDGSVAWTDSAVNALEVGVKLAS